MNDFTAELVGTMLLILLGDGVVANVLLNQTKGKSSGWIVITTGWALAVYVGVVVAAPHSGAHLNPAVTLGLALAHQFAWSKVVPFIIAQMIGAMIGSFLVWLIYKNHFDATEDPQLQLLVFSTMPAIRKPLMNLLSEIIGTFVLVFVIFYFTNGEIITSKSAIGLGSVGAIPVAFLIWAIGLSLGGTTGYAINPARDLGPRIMHTLLPMKYKGGSGWEYAWVPVAGPLIGAAAAAGLFLMLS